MRRQARDLKLPANAAAKAAAEKKAELEGRKVNAGGTIRSVVSGKRDRRGIVQEPWDGTCQISGGGSGGGSSDGSDPADGPPFKNKKNKNNNQLTSNLQQVTNIAQVLEKSRTNLQQSIFFSPFIVSTRPILAVLVVTHCLVD